MTNKNKEEVNAYNNGEKYTIKCIVMHSNIDKVHNSDSLNQLAQLSSLSSHIRVCRIRDTHYP